MRKDYDTDRLWFLFKFLLYITVILILGLYAFLILSDLCHVFISNPSYSSEELKEMAMEREKVRRQAREDNWNLIENGIHVKTGLMADEDLQLVIGACTSCHSANLITQNRATRAGWKDMIVWMQETQGLVDLGNKEPIILNYLSKHYAPREVGRRKNLAMEQVEWYILDLVE